MKDEHLRPLLKLLMGLCRCAAGDGHGEGSHGHQSVHEAAEEGPRAGTGEEEAADQLGQDGGAGEAEGERPDPCSGGCLLRLPGPCRILDLNHFTE